MFPILSLFPISLARDLVWINACCVTYSFYTEFVHTGFAAYLSGGGKAAARIINLDKTNVLFLPILDL